MSSNQVTEAGAEISAPADAVKNDARPAAQDAAAKVSEDAKNDADEGAGEDGDEEEEYDEVRWSFLCVVLEMLTNPSLLRKMTRTLKRTRKSATSRTRTLRRTEMCRSGC